MRILGIGLLGLLGGLLCGFIIHDVLARVLLDDGRLPDSMPLALLLGFMTPALGVIGVLLALVIDSRRARRRGEEAS